MANDGATMLTRLWEIQAELGLSNNALAREIGVAQSTISRLRRCGQKDGRGKRLSLDVARKIARRFPALDLFFAA